MAQRRFSRLLVAGLVIGYVGLLFLVVSMLSRSWFMVQTTYQNGDTETVIKNMVGLFDNENGAAKACQAFMIISFLTNVVACVLGMASSYAVTRPRVAGMAVKRLRLKPKKLILGPKVAGLCYVTTGIFLLISAAVATGRFSIGYSVVLAWIAFLICIISGILLIWADPPAVPQIPDLVIDVKKEHHTPRGRKIFKRKDKVKIQREETLPREIAMADTLAYEERNERDTEEQDQSSDTEMIPQNSDAIVQDQNMQEINEAPTQWKTEA